jgi:hypothetical protein
MTTQLLNLSLFAQQANVALQESNRWASLFEGIDADKRFVLLIIAMGCGLGLILGTFGIASSLYSSIHRRRVETDLKRDMLDRGMSADEIAKIIESAMPPEDACQRVIASWAKKKSN